MSTFSYRTKVEDFDLNLNYESSPMPMRAWGGGEAAQDLDQYVLATKVVALPDDTCTAVVSLYELENMRFWEVQVLCPRPRFRDLARWARAVCDTAIAELPWPDIPGHPLIAAYGPALLAEAVLHADRGEHD